MFYLNTRSGGLIDWRVEGGGGVVDVDVSDWIFYCISIPEMLVTHISSAVYFEQSVSPSVGQNSAQSFIFSV